MTIGPLTVALTGVAIIVVGLALWTLWGGLQILIDKIRRLFTNE
jgi:hypothetical protein